MGAWKTSDGGSIGQVGLSVAVVTPAVGTTDIVSAATNVAGIILRTAVISAPGASYHGRVLVDVTMVLGMYQSGTISDTIRELTRELFIPAGRALKVQTVGGAPEFHLSYDIL